MSHLRQIVPSDPCAREVGKCKNKKTERRDEMDGSRKEKALCYLTFTFSHVPQHRDK
jgi:hypothetical protein